MPRAVVAPAALPTVAHAQSPMRSKLHPIPRRAPAHRQPSRHTGVGPLHTPFPRPPTLSTRSSQPPIAAAAASPVARSGAGAAGQEGAAFGNRPTGAAAAAPGGGCPLTATTRGARPPAIHGRHRHAVGTIITVWFLGQPVVIVIVVTS